MRVRKRPIETEAYLFNTIFRDQPGICYLKWCGPFEDIMPAHIHGPRGIILVKEGDWIITGMNGCKYPIDNDTFHKIYEVIK